MNKPIIEKNLVETAFSVLKRKYGEELKARKYRNQAKEIVYVIQVRISIEPKVQN